MQSEVNGLGLEVNKTSKHSVQPFRTSNVSTAKVGQATCVGVYWVLTLLMRDHHQLAVMRVPALSDITW